MNVSSLINKLVCKEQSLKQMEMQRSLENKKKQKMQKMKENKLSSLKQRIEEQQK